MSAGAAIGTLRERLAHRLAASRRRTLDLLEPLDDDSMATPVRPYLSPPVWDLGHMAAFEELWLVRNLAAPEERADLEERYDALAVSRPARADLDLPGREGALSRLRAVREATLERLDSADLAGDEALLNRGFVYNMVLQHEAQHQETLLQSLSLRDAPYEPAASAGMLARSEDVDDEERVVVPAGPALIGTTDRVRAYDNERPRREVDVADFAIDRYPVTVRRWAAFVDDGGYGRSELWSEEGTAWRERADIRRPLGWVPRADGGWSVRLFGIERPLEPLEPVQHIAWFEAEAFARWAGGRLPTECEWEKAASWDPRLESPRPFPWGDEAPSPRLANLDGLLWRPAPVGSYPQGASALGVEQMLGDVYEWTSSPFRGYPGFEAFPYREYSEVFFGGDYRVLRGASWAAGSCLARNSYRNWDHPYRRQIFAGARLAWALD